MAMKKWILIALSATLLPGASIDPKSEKDVMSAMDAWKQATMKKDGAALEKLLHPDLTYSHSSGHNQTKADVVKTVTTGKASTTGIDFSEATVRVYGNTALVRCNVDMTNSTDGKSSKS